MEVDREYAYEQAEGVPEGDEEYITSSGESSSQTSTLTWITWFTTLPGHDFYCEVEESYIEDDFNLTGLSSQVPFWKEALEMVLDVEPEESSLTIPDVSIIESSAELLYGLVHQRYIVTKAGLQAMLEKYESGSFGSCPRYFCHGTPVLPCGRSDQPGLDTVKLYCPNCNDIYTPPSSKYQNVDGAFFGTTFPTLFFQTYTEFLAVPFKWSLNNQSGDPYADINPPPEWDPTKQDMPYNPNPYGGTRPPMAKIYEAKIYGFKVSERARSGPRMQWLRERPERYGDLDEFDWKGRSRADLRSSSSGKSSEASVVADLSGARPVVGKGKLFEDEEELKENDEEDVSEEETAAAAPAS
ncbi:hypothetical protein NliqN6_4043 [Naganishia liquefaciens]|uniref:Casein kinase II subunit beta n=1 Tax=Naganishia liquefaciens TaxID=104408 RepID=A0A8H3YHH3_9TREE|nr:hypothetical protein NliqN6_4043 [Naganishia liquefaciens]